MLVLLVACGTTTPLAREVEVGRDAYIIFTGDGRGSGSDLFAVPGRGGRAIQLTYSPVEEFAPALAPDGGAVAFLRRVPSGAHSVWVLNLLSGAERELESPDSAANPVRAGWSPDGAELYVATDDGTVWRSAAPPRSAESSFVPAGDPGADSALAVLVGTPAFARVESCASDEAALCVESADGVSPLAQNARFPSRWGTDSLAYFVGSQVMVRPLGAGRMRPVEIDAGPPNPRELTAFAPAIGRNLR
jgi:hypothetical protein